MKWKKKTNTEPLLCGAILQQSHEEAITSIYEENLAQEVTTPDFELCQICMSGSAT